MTWSIMRLILFALRRVTISTNSFTLTARQMRKRYFVFERLLPRSMSDVEIATGDNVAEFDDQTRDALICTPEREVRKRWFVTVLK